jgi:hypothetical protein
MMIREEHLKPVNITFFNKTNYYYYWLTSLQFSWYKLSKFFDFVLTQIKGYIINAKFKYLNKQINIIINFFFIAEIQSIELMNI